MPPMPAAPARPIGPHTGRSPAPERPDAPVRADSAPANNRSLVVVSNRLPFTAERRPEGTRFRRSAGGLVAAPQPVLAQRGGVWVGWTGAAREDGAGDAAGGRPPAATDHVRYRALPLTAPEIALYLAGFANRTTWPVLHKFLGH